MKQQYCDRESNKDLDGASLTNIFQLYAHFWTNSFLYRFLRPDRMDFNKRSFAEINFGSFFFFSFFADDESAFNLGVAPLVALVEEPFIVGTTAAAVPDAEVAGSAPSS